MSIHYYAEKVGEAVHSRFKPTWARFKKSEGLGSHGDHLLSAVKDFGSKKIS